MDNLALIIASVAVVLSLLALYFSGKLRKLRQIFGPDHQSDNLEEVITSITDKLKEFKTDHQALAEQVQQQGLKLETTFQYSSVIRFDSGGTDGGNLSFALALLDGHQSGMIVTSLHGREHNRIYCKAIVEGVSQTQLSEEEQEALIQALTRNGTNKLPKQKSRKVNN